MAKLVAEKRRGRGADGARGASNQEIAEVLCITEGTVKQHVTHIYRKVKIKTRAAAVAWAWEHGVVKK
ncbi:MAG: LuxR C-terminal-related transcriptional regulator [Anaerolineae bacterium]|nr:LuxR C-terminal-related transcriptional regulator [Anaerolineae bacterium]